MVIVEYSALIYFLIDLYKLSIYVYMYKALLIECVCNNENDKNFLYLGRFYLSESI